MNESQVELGEFLYERNTHSLHLPHHLGSTRMKYGFTSGDNFRHEFPNGTATETTDRGLRIESDRAFIPRRLGHGGIVCFHRPAFSEGRFVENVTGRVDLIRAQHGFDAVVSGQSDKGIRSAFVHMENFPEDTEILLPCFGGYATRNIPPNTVHVYHYPLAVSWVHQFVLFQVGDAGMMLRFDDPSCRIKRLILSTLEPEYGLQIAVHVDPAGGAAVRECVTPPFKFEAFEGGWETAARRYRDWLEFDRGLKPFRSAEIVPQRQRDIALEVNLRGHNWGPFIYNTFEQMRDRLRELSNYIHPKHCLAYIEGFDGGYVHPNTVYQPGEEIGGSEGFRRLIDLAHELGYLIAPYVHTHVLTEAHPQFEHFRASTFDTWESDTDGDGVCERMFWNVRVDDAEWNAIQLRNLSRLFESFAIDGILMDQVCIFSPRPNPEKYTRGCRDFLKGLREVMRPDQFLMSECLAEPYLDFVRMGQTPVHCQAYAAVNARGKDMFCPLDHMRFHPVLRYISNYFGRLIGHSSVRAAQEVEVHEYQMRTYAELGIIPILNLHRADEKIADTPQHLATIERAKRLAEGLESPEYGT